MEAIFKSSPLFTVKAEGGTHTELWGNLASLAEIFSDSACGACGEQEIVPIKRVVDDVAHYEMKCRSCSARLSMGQNKKGGTLYPRRKYHEAHPDVKSGRVKWNKEKPPFLPNNGWEVYKGERNDSAE